MHKIRFPLGLRPRPSWVSLQRSPEPLAVFKGAYFKGRNEGEGKMEGRGRWREREVEEGREGRRGASPPNVLA